MNQREKGKMNSNGSAIITLLMIIMVQCLSFPSVAQDFDFFYFVQQWPGSFCDTERSCCYPQTGKPIPDFGIHGLWPNYNNGSYPSNCDPNNPYNHSTISDLVSKMQTSWPSLACPSSNGSSFWAHEWEKHGTCSESVLDQHSYFKSSLDRKNKLDLLQMLKSAGIEADGGNYSVSSIKKALNGGVGYEVAIECNVDASGNSQLYQVYVCVDSCGTKVIECPVLPNGRCPSYVGFPSF